MNRVATHPAVNRWLRRVIRPAARFLPTEVLWHVPVVSVVEVRPPSWPVAPVLMANDGSDHVASMLYWRGLDGWEPMTVGLLLELTSPGATVIDVGANTGLFSLLAARRHPGVRVHAIEPAPRVFERLQFNVALNGLPNVACHQLACGEVCGRVTLYVPAGEESPMMASLVPGWSPGRVVEEGVACTTLDAFVESAGEGRVDVIKIDAEGSEDAILRGAERTIRVHRPFIFCEVLDRGELAEAITATLTRHDYCFIALGGDRPRRCASVEGGSDADENHNYLVAHRTRLGEVESAIGP